LSEIKIIYVSKIEAKSLFKVLGLVNDQQIEREAATEVGDYDRPYRHGCQEGLPRRADPHLRCQRACLANTLLNIDALLLRDRVAGRWPLV